MKINAKIDETQSNTESPKNSNQQPSQEHDLKHNDTQTLKHVKGSKESTTDVPVVDFDAEHEIGKELVSIDDVLIEGSAA